MKAKINLWCNRVIDKVEKTPDGEKRIPMDLTAREIVERLIIETGAVMSPESYKQVSISQCNETEGTSYDPKMSFEEFVQFLHKFEVIKILD